MGSFSIDRVNAVRGYSRPLPGCTDLEDLELSWILKSVNGSENSSNVRKFSVSSQLYLPDLLFQKKASDNIFIIKSTNLKTKGANVGVLIKLMNQNFSESKILHESAKLEYFQYFQWRDGGGGGGES